MNGLPSKISGISRWVASGRSPQVATCEKVPPGTETAIEWLPSRTVLMCRLGSSDSDTPPIAGSSVATQLNWLMSRQFSHLPSRILIC